MATISVTVAGYEAKMDVPTDEQLAAANTADLMLDIGKTYFQTVALDTTIPEGTRTNQLSAISALLLKFVELRADNTPALELTPAP